MSNLTNTNGNSLDDQIHAGSSESNQADYITHVEKVGASVGTECTSDQDDNLRENESVDGDVMGPPSTSTPGKGQTAKKEAYLGFKKDPELQITLLKALNSVKPFGKLHGRTNDAWESVIAFLRSHDDGLEAAGKGRVFEGVTVRVCRNNWSELSKSYKAYLDLLARTTGANPEFTRLLRFTQPVYEYEQAESMKAQDRSKDRAKLKDRRESNKDLARELLAQSRIGPSRDRQLDTPVPATSVASEPDNQEQSTEHFADRIPDWSELTPRSGTESESGASSISASSATSYRHKAMRKKAAGAMLASKMEDATAGLKRQLELQERQLEEMMEDRRDKKLRHEAKMVRDDERHEEKRTERKAMLKNQYDFQAKQHSEFVSMIRMQSDANVDAAKAQADATKAQADAAKAQADASKIQAEAFLRALEAITAVIQKQ